MYMLDDHHAIKYPNRRKCHSLLYLEKKGMTSSTMNNLKNLSTAWASALRSRSDRYIMITRAEDYWLLLSKGIVEPILSLDVLIDDGCGLRQEYSFSFDDPDDDGLMSSIIVQDQAQMIVRDNNGYYAFGIADEPAPADAMLIYARTQTKCLTILAYRDSCHVHSLGADWPTLDSEPSAAP